MIYVHVNVLWKGTWNDNIVPVVKGRLINFYEMGLVEYASKMQVIECIWRQYSLLNLAYDLKLCIYMFKKVDNLWVSITFYYLQRFKMPMGLYFLSTGGGVFVEPRCLVKVVHLNVPWKRYLIYCRIFWSNLYNLYIHK